MTYEYLTHPEAVAAAKYFIADWHENAPIMDGITFTSEVRQLARELSAKLRADIDPANVETCLDALSELDDLHFGIGKYAGLPTDLLEMHGRIISGGLDDDYAYLIRSTGARFEQVAA